MLSLYSPSSEINSFSPTDQQAERAPGGAKGEDDPEELGRSRTPHIPVQLRHRGHPRDIPGIGQKSATGGAGAQKRPKQPPREEPETSK